MRSGALAAITPVNAGLPGARSAITIQRDWSEKNDPLQTQKNHTRFFLSSLPAKEKSRATGAVRNHWSVEKRNHHKRDASAWQEDRHRQSCCSSTYSENRFGNRDKSRLVGFQIFLRIRPIPLSSFFVIARVADY